MSGNSKNQVPILQAFQLLSAPAVYLLEKLWRLWSWFCNC